MPVNEHKIQQVSVQYNNQLSTIPLRLPERDLENIRRLDEVVGIHRRYIVIAPFVYSS
jgi:hypothetical protein